MKGVTAKFPDGRETVYKSLAEAADKTGATTYHVKVSIRTGNKTPQGVIFRQSPSPQGPTAAGQLEPEVTPWDKACR